MALVTGNYVTSSGAPLPSGAIPQVEAVPSKNAVTVDGRIVSVAPQTVTPNATTGAFTLDLIPTVDVLDRGFHYLLRGYYLKADTYGSGGHTRVDSFEMRIYVPAEGGTLGNLAVVETAWGLAWQGPTPPAVSMLWLYTEPTYDPNSGNPLPVYTAPDGSTIKHGELVEWSA